MRDINKPSENKEHTRRFSGLMSLWTILRPWRYLSALARLYTIALPSRSVYFVEDVIASKRSPPCKSVGVGRKEQFFNKTKPTNLRSLETLHYYSFSRAIQSGQFKALTLTSSITKYSSVAVSISSISMIILGCFTLRSIETSFSIKCSCISLRKWKNSKHIFL